MPDKSYWNLSWYQSELLSKASVKSLETGLGLYSRPTTRNILKLQPNWKSLSKVWPADEISRKGRSYIRHTKISCSFTQYTTLGKSSIFEAFTYSFFCLQHSVWKPPKMSHLSFSSLAFSTNFCPFKTDMSGNTVWPQASGFQKLAKMDHLWHF